MYTHPVRCFHYPVGRQPMETKCGKPNHSTVSRSYSCERRPREKSTLATRKTLLKRSPISFSLVEKSTAPPVPRQITNPGGGEKNVVACFHEMKWLLHFAFTTEAAPPPLGSWFHRGAPYQRQRSNISNSKIQQCGFYAFPACEIRVPRRFCNCVAARFPPPAYPTTVGRDWSTDSRWLCWLLERHKHERSTQMAFVWLAVCM